MKTITFLALLAAVSDAAPQRRDGGLLDWLPHFWPYFPKLIPTTNNEPAPAPFTIQSSSAVVPQVKSTTVVGLLNDPQLNRDSCNSVNFGNRILWTCRDTQYYASNGSLRNDVFISTTASWSNYNGNQPAIQSLNSGADPYSSTGLRAYGNNSITDAYFPINPNKFCSTPTGGCKDYTRYVIWPDTGALKASFNTAYTWIVQAHITLFLGVVDVNPPTTLYRINYDGSSSDALPVATAINENFWGKDEIPYGVYGSVVRNGIAYLYGQANGTTSLAKVPLSLIESKSAYQFYVNGTWTSTMPAINSSSIHITNANAGGQGTYYFSKPWNSYVWIGGSQFPGADMYITTAPDPAGPWIQPQLFYRGVNGNYSLPAYSIQANPALARDEDWNGVWVSYTKVDTNAKGDGIYSTPLIKVEWQ